MGHKDNEADCGVFCWNGWISGKGTPGFLVFCRIEGMV